MTILHGMDFFALGARSNESSDSDFQIAGLLGGFLGFGGRTINGNDRGQLLIGTLFSDVINGRGGDDTILGLTGDDDISGGQGNDLILGGLGDDDIEGDAGNDVIFGGLGDDDIEGGNGDDGIEGGFGDDTLNGGRGTNAIDGGAGEDTLVLEGSFSDYSFEFLDNGKVIVEGNGARNTVSNVERLRDGFGTQAPVVYTLQLLHASDLEGNVRAIANAPNFAAILDLLDDEYANTLVLSAGDNYIPSPFFNAAADPSVQDELQAATEALFGLAPGSLPGIDAGAGRVDITIMNILGFDASAIGNHEFDQGPGVFASIIAENFADGSSAELANWFGAQFPYLSANLDFSNEAALAGLVGPAGQPSTAVDSTPGGAPAPFRIAPSTIIEEGGEKIGVVGATTQLLESITTEGNVRVIDPDNIDQNDMVELAAILQPVIDDLIAQGINKIILTSHLQQISLETELASLLSGVDIIIAGGSDTLLADDEDVARGLQPGAVPAADYPVVTTDADGNTTLIVSTDGEYSYVGRLVVDFDVNGNIITSSLDEAVSGAFASTDDVVADLYGVATVEEAIAASDKATEVQKLATAVNEVIAESDGNVFGNTEVFLDGLRASVRTEETNLGNLTADANLAVAQSIDPTVTVSIKNGGGIRDDIGEIDSVSGELLPPFANEFAGKAEGDISQLDIQASLAFNNALSIVTVTNDGLAQILEHAVAATAPGATPGQFAQVAGVAYSFDPTQPAGSRIVDAVLTDADGNTTSVLVSDGVVQNPADTVRLVTLSFLADGGDNYPFPSLISDRVDLVDVTPGAGTLDGAADFADFGTEQDALAEYLAVTFPADALDPTDALPSFTEAETDPAEDRRIVNLSVDGAPTDPFGLGV